MPGESGRIHPVQILFRQHCVLHEVRIHCPCRVAFRDMGLQQLWNINPQEIRECLSITGIQRFDLDQQQVHPGSSNDLVPLLLREGGLVNIHTKHLAHFHIEPEQRLVVGKIAHERARACLDDVGTLFCTDT